MVEENKNKKVRLKKIGEAGNYFIEETNQNV